MKWIVDVRRDTGKYFQVRTNTRVCSRHSKPSDYLPSLAGHKRTLKPAEIQSVFPWKKEPTKRSPIKRKKATETTNANADVPTCDSTRCEIFNIENEQLRKEIHQVTTLNENLKVEASNFQLTHQISVLYSYRQK